MARGPLHLTGGSKMDVSYVNFDDYCEYADFWWYDKTVSQQLNRNGGMMFEAKVANHEPTESVVLQVPVNLSHYVVFAITPYMEIKCVNEQKLTIPKPANTKPGNFGPWKCDSHPISPGLVVNGVMFVCIPKKKGIVFVDAIIFVPPQIYTEYRKKTTFISDEECEDLLHSPTSTAPEWVVFKHDPPPPSCFDLCLGCFTQRPHPNPLANQA